MRDFFFYRGGNIYCYSFLDEELVFISLSLTFKLESVVTFSLNSGTVSSCPAGGAVDFKPQNAEGCKLKHRMQNANSSSCNDSFVSLFSVWAYRGVRFEKNVS